MFNSVNSFLASVNNYRSYSTNFSRKASDISNIAQEKTVKSAVKASKELVRREDEMIEDTINLAADKKIIKKYEYKFNPIKNRVERQEIELQNHSVDFSI